jgi:hypothetical protein
MSIIAVVPSNLMDARQTLSGFTDAAAGRVALAAVSQRRRMLVIGG